MPKHDKILSVLFNLAQSVEPVANARLASCLVYKNNIVCFGINQAKTHPQQTTQGFHHEAIFLHAENSCIINSRRHLNEYELSRSILYVCRAKKLRANCGIFIPGLAKPCLGCMNAIEQSNVKKVIYSNCNEGYTTISREWINNRPQINCR